MNLNSNINSFLLSLERRQLSKSTIRLYSTVLGEMEKKVEGWEMWTGVRHYLETIQGKPGTINLKITIVRSFFNWSIKNRLCKENPTDGVDLVKVSNQRTRFLTIDEISLLLEACEPEMMVIVSIAVMTGLRRSAILGLKYAEIDTVNRRITVASKGKVHRIPITDTLWHILETYWRNLPKKHTIYLFPNATGNGPLDNNYMIKFRNICRSLGWKDVCFHTLRHSFASILLKSTGNIYLVQKALGHASITTTQRYSHLVDSDIADGLNKMNMEVLTDVNKKNTL